MLTYCMIDLLSCNIRVTMWFHRERDDAVVQCSAKDDFALPWEHVNSDIFKI
jgi:hypothetical protein